MAVVSRDKRGNMPFIFNPWWFWNIYWETCDLSNKNVIIELIFFLKDPKYTSSITVRKCCCQGAWLFQLPLCTPALKNSIIRIPRVPVTGLDLERSQSPQVGTTEIWPADILKDFGLLSEHYKAMPSISWLVRSISLPWTRSGEDHAWQILRVKHALHLWKTLFLSDVWLLFPFPSYLIHHCHDDPSLSTALRKL